MVKICNSIYPNNSKYSQHFELYPFPLSDFQKYAIEAIVEGHHVLVTAHTGSGKTLPAEFAIEHFAKQGKKVIYTSPIKALSNQKYSEFTRKYPHISFGLLTGDIKTNPTADVLIMTTEILMNALFRQGTNIVSSTTTQFQFQIDIDTELACVVFDEVHYINDVERGQTWEKTILMLPKHIQMVMLSATIDNPERFAKWAERGGNNSNSSNRSKEVYLASTDTRVVPLSHYGYLAIGEGTFKNIKDKTLEKEVRDATQTLIPLQNDKGHFYDNGHKILNKMTKLFDEKQIVSKRKFVLNNLAQFLRDRDMLPAIAFVFSRKQVEMCASEITVPLLEDDSKVGYTVRRECEQIVRKLPNFQEYLELPEYGTLVGLLEKGIGIHHSGMIPILREIVEIMISKKVIKILFATESFAIGLDCPIKTAIFTGLTKFDGRNERLLLSHEYTQMAGRAGRRGIDTIGHVVHCNNLFELPALTEYKAMLSGRPQNLESKFRISYNLILSIMSNHQNTSCSFQDFVQFVKKSMIYDELQITILNQKIYIADKENALQNKRDLLCNLRTPVDKCRSYLTAVEKIKTAVNKRRKELEREVQTIKDDYSNLMDDATKVKLVDIMTDDLKQDQRELEYIENYINEQVGAVCTVLTKNGYIERVGLVDRVGQVGQDDHIDHIGQVSREENSYCLTPLGKMASGIAEIHPLIISKKLVDWKWFSRLTTEQIIGLLAAFTDVKVSAEQKRSVPHSDDTLIQSYVQELYDQCLIYDDLERAETIRTGINYEDLMNFDMTDFAMDWTKCLDEYMCKEFIQTCLADKGISVGDFTKAMLKISTMAKELSAVAEMAGEIECLHKLSLVDGLVLKYVTTAQSLYI